MRFSLIPRILFLILALALLTASVGAAQTGQANRERLTVRWVAQTLNRMGEEGLAKRLTEDYFVNNRIHFGAMRSSEANAETGRGRSGKNEITFSNEMLRIGDQDRLLRAKPYGQSSPLISWAITAAHEYQHMDQQDPQNRPPWEDPAWQATDRMVATWAQRLENEYNLAVKMRPSKERDAKIAEIEALTKRLLSELGALTSAILGNMKNGSLSDHLTWQIPLTEKRLRGILAAMAKRTAVGKLAAPSTPPKTQREGYWELVQTDFFDKLAASDTNYSISASNGSFTAKWRMNNDVFNFTATWTPPPKRIAPTDRIPIDLAIQITQNQGDQYSANGDFAVWFDKPDCEPGSVISPIRLKGTTSETGYLAVSHRPGAPVPPAVKVFIDGKSLPTGSRGARIALMVAVYNGRSGGVRYIYEWKDPW